MIYQSEVVYTASFFLLTKYRYFFYIKFVNFVDIYEIKVYIYSVKFFKEEKI